MGEGNLCSWQTTTYDPSDVLQFDPRTNLGVCHFYKAWKGENTVLDTWCSVQMNHTSPDAPPTHLNTFRHQFIHVLAIVLRCPESAHQRASGWTRDKTNTQLLRRSFPQSKPWRARYHCLVVLLIQLRRRYGCRSSPTQNTMQWTDKHASPTAITQGSNTLMAHVTAGPCA